jgi:copper transport protein
VIGVVLTDRYVWRGVSRRPVLQHAMQWALLAIVGLAAVQLLVLASDIAGRAPWAALGSLDAALSTGAGMAMGVRMVLGGALWLLLFHTSTVDEGVRRSALALGGLAMLGTWAWAGHAVNQRWPELGFPFDVAHHAAAALWIAALLIVGVLATRRLAPDELTPVVTRLSRAASISVALIVATGVVQSVRLVGNPARLFDAAHGTYLAVKLLAVAAMLALASLNRRRIHANSGHTNAVTDTTVGQLRRSILAEFAVGLIVIGITTAMVVSPPAIAAPERGDPDTAIVDHYSL